MTKTNPTGVRFDKELLEKVKKSNLAKSPQKALNLYEKSYMELIELKIKINNNPENKEIILKERGDINSEIKFSKVTPKSYDGKKSDNLKLDEVGQLKEPALKKEMPANLSRIEKMKWIRENS